MTRLYPTMTRLVVICALIGIIFPARFGLSSQDFYKRQIKIPNKIFNTGPDVFCTAQLVAKDQYLVKFEPVVEKPGTISGISVSLCDEPYSDDYIWPCSGEEVCAPGSPREQLLYSWDQDAPTGWALPEDVGIVMGEKKRHVVVQVRSTHEFNDTDPTETGIELTLRGTRPPFEAGMAVMGNSGVIPPNVQNFTADSGCEWTFNRSVTVVAYSVHTRSRGKAVSAYMQREQVWHEIGRADPRYPDMKMDILHKRLELQPGDAVAARCTFDNDENRSVPFHHGDDGEVCNVIIHYVYHTNADDALRHVQCVADAATFHWTDFFPVIPADASEPTFRTEQSAYIKKYHLKKDKSNG